ncbi:uncharacterized protein [Temnothorax nylanderi]|uniref:uncharacterized protein n=1 Tax=Temnothorax nylanderi TaxID=102681 RepID=UPI003A8853FB
MTTSYKKCEVEGCTFNIEKKYHFPKLLERCRQWISACGNRNLLQLSHKQLREKVVCDAHFEQRFKFSKRLSNMAIPTLNLPDSIDTSIYNPNESQRKNIDLPVTATNVTKTLIDYSADLSVIINLESDPNKIAQIKQTTSQVTDEQFDADEIGQIEQTDTASIEYSNITDTEQPNCSTSFHPADLSVTINLESDPNKIAQIKQTTSQVTDEQFDADEIGQIEQTDTASIEYSNITDTEQPNCSTSLVPQRKLKRKLSTKEKKKGSKRNKIDLYSQPWRCDLY